MFKDNTYNSRAVLYVRTSTARQSREKIFSLDAQLKELRQYANRNNWYIVAEFIENESAYHEGLQRTELNRIRNIVRNGDVDAILFYDLSRFTRDVADGIILYREFAQYGVRIISITEGEITDDNQLLFIFTNYQNQEYVRKTREKVILGLKQKAEAGIYHGTRGAPYGYEIIGRRKQTQLRVIEDRASIVRYIFTAYAIDGFTVTQIADHLSSQRLITPGELLNHPRKRDKGIWSFDVVKGTIRNELYKGIYYSFKTKKIDGKAVIRPKEEWIALEVPAIVPVALWDLANTKMDEGKINSPRNKVRDYLAGSRIECAICGSHCAGNYTPKGNVAYYRCNSGRSATATPMCGLPHIRADMTDDAIWLWITRLIEQPDVILMGYREVQDEMNQKAEHLREQIASIDAELSQRKEQLERLLEAFEIDSLPRDILRSRADEYKIITDQLNDRRAELDRKLRSSTISDEELQQLIDTLDRYRELLKSDLDNAGFDTRRELVEALGLFFTV